MAPCFCRSDLPVPRFYPDPDFGHGVPSSTNPFPHSSRVPDIGKVVFLTHKKERAEAILDGEGTWCCPKLPVLDRVLNALYEPRQDAGDDLPFGHAELIRVAAWLKGEAKWGEDSTTTDRGPVPG